MTNKEFETYSALAKKKLEQVEEELDSCQMFLTTANIENYRIGGENSRLLNEVAWLRSLIHDTIEPVPVIDFPTSQTRCNSFMANHLSTANECIHCGKMQYEHD